MIDFAMNSLKLVWGMMVMFYVWFRIQWKLGKVRFK